MKPIQIFMLIVLLTSTMVGGVFGWLSAFTHNTYIYGAEPTMAARFSSMLLGSFGVAFTFLLIGICVSYCITLVGDDD